MIYSRGYSSRKDGMAMFSFDFNTWITLTFAVGLLAAACAAFYRWRPSAFDTTDAFLQNVQHIPADEPASITPTGKPNVEIRWGNKHPAAIYFEYAYYVRGREYIYDWSCEEDDPEPLPVTVKMHYHRNKPSIAYRDGETKSGLVFAWILLAFGLFFLVLFLLMLMGD